MPENIDYILGTLVGKVDAILAGLTETKARQDAQDERIDAIERKIAWVSGVAAAISAAISAAAFFIDKVV